MKMILEDNKSIFNLHETIKFFLQLAILLKVKFFIAEILLNFDNVERFKTHQNIKVRYRVHHNNRQI